MDFSALKIEDLQFGGSSLAFGPSESQPDFGGQFDGKIYKPYNKKDKLGKLCEFSVANVLATQAATASGNSTAQ